MPPSYQKAGGNSCLYCVIIVANFMLILIGIGVLVVGIYLTATLKIADYLFISLMAIGVFLAILGIIGTCLRRSSCGLLCYLIILFLLFAATTTFTILFITCKKRIIIILVKRYQKDP